MRRFLIFLMASLMISGGAGWVYAQEAQSATDQQSLQNDLNVITIPEGTEFKLQLHTSINSKTARVGDRVITTLIEPVNVENITMPNGEKVAILGSLTEVFSSAENGSENVGPEGDLKGGGPSHKKQLAMFAAPTAAAAVAGGLGPGIAVGVASGLAAILIPKGKQATLLAGSLIGMRLDEDVTVNLPPGTFNSPTEPATSTGSSGASQ